MRFRAAIVACGLAALAGCSVVRVGYNQLDSIALWTADRYFDLEEHQQEDFSARFRRLYDWHRYEQLPEYAAFFTGAKKRLERGLEAADVHWFVEGIKQRYAAIASRGADDAAAFLLTVTPRQLEAARKRLDAVNRRFARENRIGSGLAEQRSAAAQRFVESLHDWFGGLTDDQERMVRAAVARMDMTAALRHQDRMRRQHEFFQLMGLRDRPAIFREKLRHWLVHWDAGRSPEYQRASGISLDQRIALIVAIDRSLSPHQRAAAVRRLEGYIDDFTALAERPGLRSTALREESAYPTP